MPKLSKGSIRRLFAAHDLTIHALRHNRHWCVKASKNGGPVRRFIISGTPREGTMKRIIRELR
jgi:hypothetical protein